MEIVITGINFKLLKLQKSILLNMIGELDEQGAQSALTPKGQEQRDTLEGMIGLCDSIQDYAVDKLKMKETEVFHLDMFEHRDELPPEVDKILDSFDTDADPYIECARVNEAIKPLGYSFDWGLDGQPFDLKEILTHNQ